MGRGKKYKEVEWKDTNTFLFTPKYKYSLPVRNRFIFFWCKAANYRKTINFAEKFTAPYNICAVYIWGDVKPEAIEAYLSKKQGNLLALHMTGVGMEIETIDRYEEWLKVLKARGQQKITNTGTKKSKYSLKVVGRTYADEPSEEWIEEYQRLKKAVEDGYDDGKEWLDRLQSEYDLWKIHYPEAMEILQSKLAVGYNAYGVARGSITGAEDKHNMALVQIAKTLFPYGIESDTSNEFSCKSAPARKLANAALSGNGADSLGINLPGAMKQLSFFDITTIGANEAINTLQGWCDEEMKNRGCVSLNEAWELLEHPPFGAYICNWYMWIFAYALRKYTDGNYFTGDLLGYTCRIQKGGDGLVNAIAYAADKSVKRKGDTAIFTQNAEQDEFMRIIWKLFDVDKPWNETTSSAIGQARSWITDNVHYSPLALIDKRFGEILRYRECFCWYSTGYEKEFLPWLRDNFDALYTSIRNADNALHERLTKEYGQLRSDLYFKFYYIKGGAVGWLWDEEMLKRGIERYMAIENVCRECGRPLVFTEFKEPKHYEYVDGEEYKFYEKDITGLNKKLLGRYQNEYFCIPCLCEVIDCDAARLYEMVNEFKEQGCTLF